MSYLFEDIIIDDTRVTPEHRLWYAVLLKAIQESVWKRVRIKYVKDNKVLIKKYHSRCETSVQYLADTEREDVSGVVPLCEMLDVKYGVIKRLIETKPSEYKNIQVLEFIFEWNDRIKGWRLRNHSKIHSYGNILKRHMYEVDIEAIQHNE